MKVVLYSVSKLKINWLAEVVVAIFSTVNYDFDILSNIEFDKEVIKDSIIVTISASPTLFDYVKNSKSDIIEQYYNYSLWNAYANKVIDYDTIINNELLAIKQVAYALDVQVHSQIIESIINKYGKDEIQSIG